MTSYHSFFLLLIVSQGGCQPSNHQDSHLTSSVVYLDYSLHLSIGPIRLRNSAKISEGSGFIFTEDSKFFYGATNGHVFDLDRQNEMGISNDTGDDWQWNPIEIVRTSSGDPVHEWHDLSFFETYAKDFKEEFRGDFALFRMPKNDLNQRIEPLTVLEGAVAINDIIQYTGFPSRARIADDRKKLNPIKSLGVAYLNRNNSMLTTAYGYNGSSGSPAFVLDENELLLAGILYKGRSTIPGGITINKETLRSNPRDLGEIFSSFFPFAKIRERFPDLELWENLVSRHAVRRQKAEILDLQISSVDLGDNNVGAPADDELQMKYHVELRDKSLYDWQKFLTYSGIPVEELSHFEEKYQQGFSFQYDPDKEILLPLFQYHHPESSTFKIIGCHHELDGQLHCGDNRTGNIDLINEYLNPPKDDE